MCLAVAENLFACAFFHRRLTAFQKRTDALAVCLIFDASCLPGYQGPGYHYQVGCWRGGWKLVCTIIVTYFYAKMEGSTEALSDPEHLGDQDPEQSFRIWFWIRTREWIGIRDWIRTYWQNDLYSWFNYFQWSSTSLITGTLPVHIAFRKA
jgi:hypothetical protein